jgi:DNA-binding beta-propeller fold protein YncE
MRKVFVNAALACALLGGATPAHAAGLEAKYLYDLATLTGAVRLSGLGLSFDPAAGELFTVGYGTVRIFNSAGVQTYSFVGDEEYGAPLAVAALDDGDLLLLTYRGNDYSIVRSNFRGEPQGRLGLAGIPPEFAQDFNPGAIVYAKGRVYLADFPRMKVAVFDERGGYVASYDLATLIDLDEKKREDAGLGGFNVDPEGNLLFTVPPLFKAYVLAPGGEVRSVGTPGSAPGKFNVVAGIAGDDSGRLYVVDMLKCAVIVFDRDLRFLGEFGYRGYSPGRLIAPRSVAVGNGNVYVAQYGGRGVTVYRVAESGSGEGSRK